MSPKQFSGNTPDVSGLAALSMGLSIASLIARPPSISAARRMHFLIIGILFTLPQSANLPGRNTK